MEPVPERNIAVSCTHTLLTHSLSSSQNEEVEEKAAEVLPSGLLEQLAHANWKKRLAGHEQFKEFVEGLSPGDMQSLLFVKVLARKPGWEESNFQASYIAH